MLLNVRVGDLRPLPERTRDSLSHTNAYPECRNRVNAFIGSACIQGRPLSASERHFGEGAAAFCRAPGQLLSSG
jgi:hypothetical protein